MIAANRKRILVAAIVIAAVLVLLLARGLGNATMYFRTADEAIEQRQELGEKRFRIEGTVVSGSLQQDGINTDFAISSKNTTVAVDNKAETQGIFREGIPVVLEGNFEKGTNTFVSDRVMVKHDSNYTEEYPERVSGAANQ
jgi:cytochrome c-type biogenesis protein CcmE